MAHRDEVGHAARVGRRMDTETERFLPHSATQASKMKNKQGSKYAVQRVTRWHLDSWLMPPL